MRDKYTSIVTLIIAITAVLCTALLSSSCATSGYRHLTVDTSYLQDENNVYQGYDSEKISKSNIATVRWDRPQGMVWSIDGVDVRYFSAAELLPGLHKFECYVDGYGGAQINTHIKAELFAGHTYDFQAEYHRKSKRPSDVYVSLVDVATGELVAGRTQEDSNWTWKEFQVVLEELKRKKATEADIIDLIPKPHDRISSNVLIYIAYTYPYNRAAISAWYRGHNSSSGSARKGFLFLEFDESDHLEDYMYISAPLHQCNRNFWKWDWDAAMAEEDACRYSMEKRKYAEYYALTKRPFEAYKILESGLKVRSQTSNYRRDILLHDSRLFIEKYPDVLRAGKASFTPEALDAAFEQYGELARDIETARLAIYKQLASSEDYAAVESSFTTYIKSLQHD